MHVSRWGMVLAVTVLAAGGGCDALPGGGDVPTSLPTGIELPDGVPTALPGLPTELPSGLPTALPTDLPTALPDLPEAPDGATTAAPAPAATDGQAAPAPTADPAAPTDPATGPGATTEPVEGTATEDPDGIPWWVWALLVALVVGLVVAIVLLRRARAAELRWAALWHDLTGEARWLDERVVPAVQDRALDPQTVVTRWQDGQRRFDDLDRRVWAAAHEEKAPARVGDLNALSEALLRLRDAVDTEVSLRASGIDQPGLPDAAQTVADARDDLRRTVSTRTR